MLRSSVFPSYLFAYYHWTELWARHSLFGMKIPIYTLGLWCGVVLLAGCERDQVQTYRVSKVSAVLPVAENQWFSAELPDGWAEQPGSGMRMATYTIEGTSIDFYLISLGMGDVVSNVNRWRGQVGLPPVSSEKAGTLVETFDVQGIPVQYARIYHDAEGLGIIAAILPVESSFWYFTAKGSVRELRAHEAEIRQFIQSVQVK